MTHPITQTLQRGRHRRHGLCDLELPTAAGGEGWTSVAALAADSELLRPLLNTIGDAIGSDRSDVQASLFLESYTWTLVLPLAGALVAERRVVLPTAGDLKLRPGTGHSVQLQMSPARFAVLPGDSASTHRDAILTPTHADLVEHFRRLLVAHFAAIIGALRAISVRAEPALWRTVCDRTATALLYGGLACHRQDSAEQLAHAILNGSPPLDRAPRYVDVRIDDRTSRVHLRHGCCLWWRTAAATYCATCPIRCRTR